MIAHSRQALDNRDIQQQAAEALAKSVITQAEYQRVREAYPFKLYTPNMFIRIGLFLLYVLAVACGLGLCHAHRYVSEGCPWDPRHSPDHLGHRRLRWSPGVLRIHSRGVYRAGVDDALLWVAGGLLFGGINLLE